MPTIKELRASMPELAGLDDNQAVDAIHAAYYPTLNRDDIANRLGVTPAKPVDDTGDFMRGVKKAGYQIPQTIGGTIGLVGDALGADGVRDYGMGIYQNQSKNIEAVTKPSDSLTSVLNGEEDASGMSWLKNAAGYTAGQAVTALATGGVGGLIGSQLAKRGIKEVVARGAESAIARQVAGQVASKGAKVGAVSALGASNLVQEAGSIYPDAVEQAAKDGRTLDGGDLARVAGSAVAAAAVDTGMDAFMGHKVLSGGRREGESMLRAAAREVPGMAAKEAATEGIQTGIERYGARQDLTTADAMRDYVDSMGVGAVGGGMGGGVSVLHARKVQESGPLTRGANAGLDDQILQLTNDPQPLVSFPDGSVGSKQDLHAYLSQFDDPEERQAKHRELMGLDPATGKKIQPEPEPDPLSAPSKKVEQETLKAWGARHEPATLEYAQNLINSPGAKGQSLMVAPHPDGGGFTVVPSNFLTLDSQAKLANLQKPFKEGTAQPPYPTLTDKIAPADGIPVLNDVIAPKDGIPVLNDRIAPADGIPVLNDRVPSAQKGGARETAQAQKPVGVAGDQVAAASGSDGRGRPGDAQPLSEQRPTAPGQSAGTVDAGSVRANTTADDKPALDDLYSQAVDLVQKTGQPSISLVQRHLKIGYNRAARLLEQMEQNGLVSPMESNGARTIKEQPQTAPAAETKTWDADPYAPNVFHNEKLAHAFMKRKQIDPAAFEVVPTGENRWGVKPKADAPAADVFDAAAHQAATSPLNDLPEPTQAQKEAGNYKVGHVQLHGLDISVENPAGSTRRGIDKDGKPWENTLAHHYGYIRKTLGADGDHVDTFIGPNLESDRAYVVDQIPPHNGKFDEHKVLLGFDSLDAAKAGYAASYAKDWKGGENVVETSVEGLKTWLKDGDTTKPFAPQAQESSNATTDHVPADGKPAAGASDATGDRAGRDQGGTAATAAPADPGATGGVSNGDVQEKPGSQEVKAAPTEKEPNGNNSEASTADAVLPSESEIVDGGNDTGADIPLAFFKKVKVPHDHWIEDEKAFVSKDVPASVALKSVREDIDNLQKLLKCLKG